MASLDVVAMKDVVHEKKFTILRIEDLNSFPWMKVPANNEISFFEGGCCYETQPLGMYLGVTKRYVDNF